MTYVPPTPAHYIAAHSAGYTGFRDMVVEAAEWWLCRHPGIHSTKDLSDGLWPNRLAHGHDIEIRKRMVDALLKCADRELKAYAHRGPTTGKVYGHAKRPWLWSKPERAAAVVETIEVGWRVATDAEVAGIISQVPGAEYLSNAQKLAMARHLLDNFMMTFEA